MTSRRKPDMKVNQELHRFLRNRTGHEIETLSRFKLLIIDELGFVPLSRTGAELLFEVFGSERLTGALPDRPHPPRPHPSK